MILRHSHLAPPFQTLSSNGESKDAQRGSFSEFPRLNDIALPGIRLTKRHGVGLFVEITTPGFRAAAARLRTGCACVSQKSRFQNRCPMPRRPFVQNYCVTNTPLTVTKALDETGDEVEEHTTFTLVLKIIGVLNA